MSIARPRPSLRAAAAFALAGLMALGSVGCVSQREVDELRSLYFRSAQQVEALKAQLEEKDNQIAALQQQLGSDADLASQLAAARTERDRLAAALAEAERRLREAGSTVTALPPQLDSALRDLAMRNPELMSYDPALGMVRFRSDFTFALGSIEVRENARQALSQLAAIVRSPDARGFEVRIVGHTDNVPVTNPANRQRFRDNWGLSVWRAISVKDVLEQNGVQPARMSVVGYGEYHPVAPNPPRGGNEANRRVEIFLVASPKAGSGDGGASVEDAGALEPEPERPDFFK